MRRRILTGIITLTAALCLVTGTAWAGKLVLKGSTTVLPIAQKVAEAYMQDYPDADISVSGGGSGNGIKALIDGNTDIANASRFIKQAEVERAVSKDRYPVPFAVAYDSIIPVVHPSNSVSELSLSDLKAIYEGDVRNWKELGGPDREVVVVSRDTSSGTYEVWEERVLKGARVTPRAQLLASNGAVVQAVSRNKNAVGYVGIGYLNDELKAVKVDGVMGTKETTASGEYPISRALFMFTEGWPTGETAKFINYLLHPDKGQPLVEETGYVAKY